LVKKIETKKKIDEPIKKLNNNRPTNGTAKKRWYLDKTYFIVAGIFIMCGIILYLRAELNTSNNKQDVTDNQILYGINRTLTGLNSTLVIVNATSHTPANTTQDFHSVKSLLEDINRTLANPNKTINTKPS
jgi:preprotein translocase subunit SecG